MRGFELTTAPVYLRLTDDILTALGLPPATDVTIDGAATEATDYGILTTVNDIRYFVPWGKIIMIRQSVPAPVVAPSITLSTPAPTGSDVLP